MTRQSPEDALAHLASLGPEITVSGTTDAAGQIMGDLSVVPFEPVLSLSVEAAHRVAEVLSYVSRGHGWVHTHEEPYPDATARRALAEVFEAFDRAGLPHPKI